MSRNQTIFILDDHQIVIDGVRMMLEGAPGLQVVGSSTQPEAALTEIAALKPDAIICDVHMPGMTGIEVSKRLRKSHPAMRILILTMANDPALIQELMLSGVHGIVLKSKGRDELLAALETIRQGTFFSDDLIRQATALSHTAQKPERLTLREIEIIKLLAAGRTSPQIAAGLFISEHTVETHRRNILRKTGTHTTVDLINYARRNSIVV